MKSKIELLLNKQILVLDGGMGTMIQSYRLSEKEFRNLEFAEHNKNLRGFNDILNITQPQIIKEIHTKYLLSGANIIETNTFNSSSISLQDYNLEKYSYNLNKIGAQLARSAINEIKNFNSNHCFVAGSIGPTNRTASISPDVNRPGYRDISYIELYNSYSVQVGGLIDGGVDLLLIETIFDTINAKAALHACKDELKRRNIELPISLSVTLDKSGRTLSGQTLEAFINSFSQNNIMSIGLNCSFGAKEMFPFLQQLSDISNIFVSAYPNAGLPNELGKYIQTPEIMGEGISNFLKNNMVNIIGGCCGTTPEHIKIIANMVKDFKPKQRKENERRTIISGLEILKIEKENNFINIGERTNVGGSKKFLKLILEKRYEDAVNIAIEQVEQGAQIIDISFDDGMLDAKQEMDTFLKYVSSEPLISKVPIMLDSSNFEVIEIGLKLLQGKGIVNSISLKDGELQFLEKAKKIMKYGAAIVVMAFDEKGQATDFESKISISQRAYNLLKSINFPPEDIIFDCNILTIATGIKEHNTYASDFIKSVRWIKENLKYSKTSGGISNLSFAFRGNDSIRASMHSVFLYHAIKNGLDMGIINAGKVPNYDNIDISLRTIIEDVIFNKSENSIEKLIEYSKVNNNNFNTIIKDNLWRNFNINERLIYAVVNGNNEFIDNDIAEAIKDIVNPITIIEGPLMEGMNIVGDNFNLGKMFLPQVIKSARVMKKAVSCIIPEIYNDDNKNFQNIHKSTIILATVKGDVHDIGKNIAAIILSCNNNKIIDLGTMVDANNILNKAIEHKADIVGLSGLITPSLDEMIEVVKLFKSKNIKIPIIIGGATTSEIHTAIKISPHYDIPVFYVKNASDGVKIVNDLIENREKTILETKERYKQISNEYTKLNNNKSKKYISLLEARKNKFYIDWQNYRFPKHNIFTVRHFENLFIENLVFNIDWNHYFIEWQINLKKQKQFDKSLEILKEDSTIILQHLIENNLIKIYCSYGIYIARSEDESIFLYNENKKNVEELIFLRNQESGKESNLCLSDFIAPKSLNKNDYMGLFVVSIDVNYSDLKDFDEYQLLIVKILANTIAERYSELLHNKIFQDLNLVSKTGIRPAPGYPCCPDHSEKNKIFKLLDISNHFPIELTENFMITPPSSICGYYFFNSNSKYFDVGKINQEQINEYSIKKNIETNYLKKLLPKNIL